MRIDWKLLGASAFLCVVACGDSDDGSNDYGYGDDTFQGPMGDGDSVGLMDVGGDPSGVNGGGNNAGTDPNMPLAMVPDNCVGFEVAGLEFSPGGDVLPNTCSPFDTILNNPYAIRCVDADPSFDTGYGGDDYCILPPPSELGTQVHVGPESYDNIDPGYIMQPGREYSDYYFTNTTNAESHFFYRVNMRMRPGSHHMINRMLPIDRTDGWRDDGDNADGRGFPGAQRPDQDRPNGILQVPPENAGIGDEIEANQQFSFNLHHFNLTDRPALREIWVNIWYKPEAEVTETMGRIGIYGNPRDLDIPVGEQRVLHYKCDVASDTRVLSFSGHRHSSTARFGVWLEPADGGPDVVLYESFDYTDMPTYSYDSISQNPVPSVPNADDGALTGMLELHRGDELHFVCDVTNTGDQTLRFANEVETGEMCILFGNRTGGELCRNGTRVYD